MNNLKDNWKHIAQKAWSMKFMFFAVVFAGLDLLLTLLPSLITLSKNQLAVLPLLAMGSAGGGMWARLQKQKSLPNEN